MPIAGGNTIAVVDFHHQAIAGAVTGIGHDTGAGGNNRCAFLAGKIHPFMPGHTAGERIRTTPEAAGHPTLGQRPAGQVGLVLDLLAGQQVFQNLQLTLAAFQGLRHLVHRFHKGRQFVAGTLLRAFRSTQARDSAEIKLFAVNIGHFHQPLTQRIQPNQTSLGLGQFQGQCPELLLAESIQGFQGFLLLFQMGGETFGHYRRILGLIAELRHQ